MSSSSEPSTRTETFLDDDDGYDYDDYDGSTTISHNKSQNDEENESKEHKKKLLISLGMLLPAIASIIGVMAWAISAEVVLGAKREAMRRIGESNYLKLPNRYDYTRFTSAPLLPPKEMLIDDFNYYQQPHRKLYNDDSTQSNPSNLNVLQKHLEELSKEYLSRRVDVDESSLNSKMDELKSRLTHENISQLFAKLFNNHQHKLNQNEGKNKPRILVVAPLASQSKNVSKVFVSETRVTTSKPKALELKIVTPKENNSNNNKNIKTDSAKATLKASMKRKVVQNGVNQGTISKPILNHNSKQAKIQMDSKRKTSNQIVITNEKKLHSRTVAVKNVPGKTSKSKAYEKEIDSLLQKIEKLEKQKLSPKSNLKLSDNIQKNQLLKKKYSDIAEKIQKFMDSAPKEEPKKEPFQENNQWDSVVPMIPPPPLPPPPPPMPPMPFMPFIPPLAPAISVNQQEETEVNVEQHPTHNEINQNQMPIQEEYQPQAYSYPESYVHQQPVPPPSPQQPSLSQNSYTPNLINSINYPQNEGTNFYPQQQQQQAQSLSIHIPNQMNMYSQQLSPTHNSATNEINMTPENQKPNKASLFGRRFQFSKIFHSVIPKSKKKKQEEAKKVIQVDNGGEMMPLSPPSPPHNNGNVPFDSMMTQESQYHSSVDRGYRGGGYPMEAAGMQVRFGGGPLGGGSQVKVNPMAILKTLAFPLMRRPALNLNGKVVFGVVLENGVGHKQKPKTVFQHYSTGRIKR